MQRFILILRSNWISFSGAVIATVTFMSMLTTFIYMSLHGAGHGAYIGLFGFVVLPTIFALAIGVIPIGLLIYRRQLRERIELLTHKPLRLVRLLVLLTVINLAVLGTGGYEALHYMDSQQFCGTLCHEVMSPTYEKYKSSPHARVACVECHIGPGASWFVKSKLSGLRQVFAVLFDSYQRPIPTPVHDLRPARETCEQCHWPDKFAGDRLVVRQHFDEDEAVSAVASVLILKTGGTRPDGRATGIHWHVHPKNKVRYVSTDGKREKIDWIEWTDADGNKRIYTAEGVDPNGKPPEGEMRTMDCVDCHNQPSHGFEEPESALDTAIAYGLVSRKLPFIRKHGMEALQRSWTRDTANISIRAFLEGKYTGESALPDELKGELSSSIDAIVKIWMRNIYPKMGVTWGTYPSFAAHRGCMRCHDGEHMDEEEEEISTDCDNCHTILAEREADPEVLEKLGIDLDDR